jgi:hypothetical protein
MVCHDSCGAVSLDPWSSLLVVDRICGFLDARANVTCLSLLSRFFRAVSLMHHGDALTRYFNQRAMLSETVELALPSQVLAMSFSPEHDRFAVVTRSAEEDEREALLHTHAWDRVHGRLIMTGMDTLPLCVADSDSIVSFEGPGLYIRCAPSEGQLVVVSCATKGEVTLPPGTTDFRSSRDGQTIAIAESNSREFTWTVLPSSSLQLIQRVGSAQMPLTTPGDLPVSMDLRPGVVSFSVELKTEPALFKVSVHHDDATPLVGSEMLIAVVRSNSRGSPRVEAYFATHDPRESNPRSPTTPHSLPWAAKRCTSDLTCDGNCGTSVQSSVPVLMAPAAERLLPQHVVQCPMTVDVCLGKSKSVQQGTVFILDAVNFELTLWRPFSGTAVSRRFHPSVTRQLIPLFPKGSSRFVDQLSFDAGKVLSLQMRNRTGTEHVAILLSPDASIGACLPLRGNSLVAMTEGAMVLSLLSSYLPHHPLVEALECGVGTLLRFPKCPPVRTLYYDSGERAEGNGGREGTQQDFHGGGVHCIVWFSSGMLCLSLLWTVTALVYNGWWLHMQELFTGSLGVDLSRRG